MYFNGEVADNQLYIKEFYFVDQLCEMMGVVRIEIGYLDKWMRI